MLQLLRAIACQIGNDVDEGIKHTEFLLENSENWEYCVKRKAEIRKKKGIYIYTYIFLQSIM